MTTERRTSPRVEILGTLHGHIVALNLRIAVLEMSRGGMRIESEIAFPVGSHHAFQLTLVDESVMSLAGRVVYSRRAPGYEPKYITGVQFTDDDVASAAALMDRLT